MVSTLAKSWKVHSRRFGRFIRHGHTYRKAIYAAGCVSLAISGLGLALLLPQADHTSVQAGLTTIAGILGVLLGSVLVVVVLLVEQGRESEQFLRGIYHQYHELLESNLEHIDESRQRLTELVRSGEIRLNESVFVGADGEASTTEYCDVLSSLFALTYALRPAAYDTLEATLNDLGFDQDQRDKILFGEGISAAYDPVGFMRLAGDALDAIALPKWCGEDAADLAYEIMRRHMVEGVDGALSRLDRSRTVLKSSTLAADIVLLTSTTLGAVMALFGATIDIVSIPVYMWIVTLIVAGFAMSVVLTLLLMEKILA
jgi:hypothetical protein